jgi:hypothetical protein
MGTSPATPRRCSQRTTRSSAGAVRRFPGLHRRRDSVVDNKGNDPDLCLSRISIAVARLGALSSLPPSSSPRPKSNRQAPLPQVARNRSAIIHILCGYSVPMDVAARPPRRAIDTAEPLHRLLSCEWNRERAEPGASFPRSRRKPERIPRRRRVGVPRRVRRVRPAPATDPRGGRHHGSAGDVPGGDLRFQLVPSSAVDPAGSRRSASGGERSKRRAVGRASRGGGRPGQPPTGGGRGLLGEVLTLCARSGLAIGCRCSARRRGRRAPWGARRRQRSRVPSPLHPAFCVLAREAL